MSDLVDLTRVPTPRTPPRWRRYLETVAHLRPDQMARLFLRRVVGRALGDSIPDVLDVPSLRDPWAARTGFLDEPASSGFRPEAGTLRLLQIERPFTVPVDWEAAGAPALWQLELNYFHWLPACASWPEARPWVVDWLEHAPRDLRAQCWNPFGVAQRVLRWTRLIRGPWQDDLRDDPVLPRLLCSLYAQCRFLARHQEHELLGNHLLKTAAGLYAAGRFFAGDEADLWSRRAARTLEDQGRAQCLDDGGHYERSPMYHLSVLVDLLDALNITPPDDPFSERLRPTIARLCRFADLCAHGDGEIPLFNDSVLDHSPRRTDVLDYAARVTGFATEPTRPSFLAFPDFGLFRLGDTRSCLWLDAGATGPPFLQAHAHADTGSFELSVGAARVVCDSGVFSYQDPAARSWDRSTPAHNTVAVAGASSSDCWGRFRVARRARVHGLSWSSADGVDTVSFSHDGFRHLPASPRHERTVSFDAGTYVIHDRVVGRRAGLLRCDGFLYLDPAVTVRLVDRTPGANTWSFDLFHDTSPDLPIRLDVSFPGPAGDHALFVEPAEVSPRFHTRVPASRIRAAGVALSQTFEIEWRLRFTYDG